MNSKIPLGGSLFMTAMSTFAQQIERPNIVFIMTDDHTAQMMSCYDHRYIETPHLDRIANDDLWFTNSFMANSQSGPSRACLLTGKHSHKNGFTDNATCVFDASQQTFPALLRQAGYQTNLIIHWMEYERDKSKPFCIMIHHKAIHRNWMANTPELELYEDKVFPVPETFYDNYEGRMAAQQQEMSIIKEMDVLYDLWKDPQEKHNIYGQPGTEKVLKKMMKELHKLQKQYDDPIENSL